MLLLVAGTKELFTYLGQPSEARLDGAWNCALCRFDVDSVEHIFYHCSVWKNVFSILMEQHHLSHSFQYDSLITFLEMWTVSFSKQSVYCYLPFLAMWDVWKARNLCIFKGKKVYVISILHQIAYSS